MSAVLAVLEQRDGTLRKVSHEVVTAARRLADALGGTVDALVLGAGPVVGSDQLGRFGADRVIVLKHPLFQRYAPEAFARAVAGLAKSGSHPVVLFPASATGRDLAPRVAAQLGVPLASDVTEVAVEGETVLATRPVYAGKALLKVKITARPAVLSVRPGVFTPVERPRAGAIESPSLATAD